MISFIDDHHGIHGVEPICKVLPIAPSTYRAHVAKRAGVTTDMAEKMKALERENRELRQANEILRKASAYFAHISG